MFGFNTLGSWEREDEDDWWKCSECGWYALEKAESGYRSNYCPHCGAEMENSQEEE